MMKTNIRFKAVTPVSNKERDYPVVIIGGQLRAVTPFGNRNIRCAKRCVFSSDPFIWLPGGGAQIGRLVVKAGSSRDAV